MNDKGIFNPRIYYKFMYFLYRLFNLSGGITFVFSVTIFIFNLLALFLINQLPMGDQFRYKILITIFTISSITFYLIGILISFKSAKRIKHYKDKLTIIKK